MSENTLSTAKQQRMAAVHAAIAATTMPRALVWNPWKHVAEDGVDLLALSAPAQRGTVPDTIPDNREFSAIKAVQLSQLGAEAGYDGPVTEHTFADAKQRLRSKYVAAGRARYANLASGNCTLFACCVIGMLADQPRLLGPGVRVELFNLADTTGGGGHAYVVIGRADGDFRNLKTYGPDSFFVDVWYARQQLSSPGVNAVKDIVLHDTSNNPFWDLNFYSFMDDDNTFLLKHTFTSDELATLGR
ncbi:hypothetical protein [Sphaerisporangium aureirubrum]|uniref:Uncharacterized protein n=1 Tax=Sphaerisporangium aureirubrum TaxID=1544736 RepID=A0ABW1NSP5_9ACTN